MDDAAGRARLAAKNQRSRRLGIDGSPHAGVGGDGLTRGITDGDADTIFQPVLAVSEGTDDPILQ
jgi:hypothetical protein